MLPLMYSKFFSMLSFKLFSSVRMASVGWPAAKYVLFSKSLSLYHSTIAFLGGPAAGHVPYEEDEHS